MESMGVATGCGCNEASLLFCSFLKMFFVLLYIACIQLYIIILYTIIK